jgi:Bacterial EndoU nuclease
MKLNFHIFVIFITWFTNLNATPVFVKVTLSKCEQVILILGEAKVLKAEQIIAGASKEVYLEDFVTISQKLEGKTVEEAIVILEEVEAVQVVRHPNWIEITGIPEKVEGLTPHVLEVETNASGAFIPKNKRIGTITFNMEGFKGCHTENALKEYVQANGGTFAIKNKSVGLGGVYEGQPVIYLNNKEYVKINGAFVEYEAGKLGGTSSFFPENWSDIKIKEEVEFAIANNHGKVNPTNPTDNLHFGFSKDGTIEIQFYYNADGSIGSYFPKKR